MICECWLWIRFFPELNLVSLKVNTQQCAEFYTSYLPGRYVKQSLHTCRHACTHAVVNGGGDKEQGSTETPLKMVKGSCSFPWVTIIINSSTFWEFELLYSPASCNSLHKSESCLIKGSIYFYYVYWKLSTNHIVLLWNTEIDVRYGINANTVDTNS